MNIDRLFTVVGSALDSQRQRLNIIAGNLANSESTRSPEGGPYVRRDVVFKANAPSSHLLVFFHGPLEDRRNQVEYRLRESFWIRGPLVRFMTPSILMPINRAWCSFPM